MYDQARKDADRLKAEEREAVAQEVAARKAAAEREIGAAKEAVELATMLSAKTLRRQISPEDHRRLLDEALAELKGGPGRA
jgi:F-type H+-transporting ATPase subunit b